MIFIAMKNYLPIGCLLLLFSSCIKTEYYPLCNDVPAAPKLASNNITLTNASSFTVKVLSPVSGLTYSWAGPNGNTGQGSTLYYYFYYSNYPFGTWGVVAQKGSALCVSDTT